MTFTEQTRIEDLDLSVRQFNTLTRNGYKTIGDVTKLTVKDLLRIHNMGMSCLTGILLKLDEHGFRCADCSYEKYPDLKNSVEAVIASATRSAKANQPRPWNYGKVIPQVKFSPEGIIMPYTETLVPDVQPSADRFYIVSRDEYRIKRCGVLSGGIAIFDRTLPFKPGRLSCFQNSEGQICFNDVMREPDLIHVGRMVATVNYYS